MPLLKTNFWDLSKEYIILTLGILMYVVGWVIFLVPNNLVGGGASGISSIIQYATGIKMGYTYFVLNAVLLLIAFAIMGTGFGAKTIYAIILASVGLNLLQSIIPYEFISVLSFQNGKLMSTIMGGIMSGIGIGMSISVGGSSGGTDIIAMIVNKYHNISPGRMILSMDVVIILSSLFVPSYTADGILVAFSDKITTVVYGLILVTLNGFVIDMYLSGAKQSAQVFIMSRKYEMIADTITNEMHRGVTMLYSKGWYSKQDSNIVMVIVRQADLNILLKYVKMIDPDAFLSVSNVAGVYGKGFDVIKVAKKKEIKPAKNNMGENISKNV
jgi:hypothetical protein